MGSEQFNEILKRLEGVYKSTVDKDQKERVKKEISKIKNKISNIEQFGPEEVLDEGQDQEEDVVTGKDDAAFEEEKKEFKILSKFPVKKIHPESINPEVNMAITYIDIFESELWGALSDFHLKLDYFHSRERDKFYNALENVKRFISEYANTLNEFNDSVNKKYLEKLKSMRSKYSRSLLVDSVKLIMNIKEFIEKILSDYESGGHIIMNPDDEIAYSDIEEKKILNNWKIIDALRYIREFSEEFLGAINLPEEMLDTA